MIPKECKRLAEVDFPIAEVSRHSAREKSIRHGHPSTLHLWWARRPLAACRAMLLALLLPDPCDTHCPAEFKGRARQALEAIGGVREGDMGLRKALLDFIGNVSNWDNSNNPTLIGAARELVKAAHPEETPLVVDPFAGGGSIPLEALRLGCDAFASDLNPVACLILKVMLEDIPRHGPALAEELRRAGKEIKEQAERDLAELYPKDPDGATPIAYLWARTVRCESPNCGAEIPLMRSPWLCKKASRLRALRWNVVRSQTGPPQVESEIFHPRTDKEVAAGTVSRARATCPCCHAVLPPQRVRAQLSEQRGGADVVFNAQGNRVGGARLQAVVTLKPGQSGRHYRLPSGQDYLAVHEAHRRLHDILEEWVRGGKKGLCPVPDEPTPPGGGSGAGRAFSVQKYGMMTFGDLFTARQKVALVTLVRSIATVEHSPHIIRTLLSLNLSHVIERNTSLCRWHPDPYMETVESIYGRQALPIVWDFAEAVSLSESTGSWQHSLDVSTAAAQAASSVFKASGQSQIADACASPIPSESATVWFTDPPYYDAVPYADLSDFFVVWLKRMLPEYSLGDPFDMTNPLCPKIQEIVQDETRTVDGLPKDRNFFEEAMSRAFAEGRRVLHDDGIAGVVFAHKTTEGWEALLSGLVRGGWAVTGSWPVGTERRARMRARESAALSTSVHLVARPRPENAPVGDWGAVLQELPKRVGDWMERLQVEGIRGADLVFACIGPALEMFSRYRKVETAEGREITLAEYLPKVWEVVGRTALEQILGTAEARARNGGAGALEEDARLTALFLWTLQSTNGGPHPNPPQRGEGEPGQDEDGDEDEPAPRTKAGGFTLVYDVVRRFAQPLGIGLPRWEGRIIETNKGRVRLLPIAERARQLFGDQGTRGIDSWLDENPDALQLRLFPQAEVVAAVPKVRGRNKGRLKGGTEAEIKTEQEATTLDRVHAAMLLQAGGQANALRALLKAERERGPDFLRLANALSALYPSASEEKRLLDAMLLAAPR